MPTFVRRVAYSFARRASARLQIWLATLSVDLEKHDLKTSPEASRDDLEPAPEPCEDITNSRPSPDVVARMICQERALSHRHIDGRYSSSTPGIWRGGWLFYWSWVEDEVAPRLVVDCMKNGAVFGVDVASEAWVLEVMQRVQMYLSVEIRCTAFQLPQAWPGQSSGVVFEA